MPSKTAKTPPPPEVPSSVSIAASDFHRLVKAVMPLASRDVVLPVLCAVWLRGHGEWLTATATDRYRIGVKRLKINAPDGWQALIPTSVLRSLLATSKPSRHHDSTLTLTPDGDRLRVSVEGLASADMLGEALSFRLETGEYPTVDKLLAGYARASDPLPEGAAFNPHLLADFKAAAEGPEPMLLSAAKPNGASPTPLVVRIGDHFLGAQMAVRRAGDAPHAADWSDIFPPATDKAGAA